MLKVVSSDDEAVRNLLARRKGTLPSGRPSESLVLHSCPRQGEILSLPGVTCDKEAYTRKSVSSVVSCPLLNIPFLICPYFIHLLVPSKLGTSHGSPEQEKFLNWPKEKKNHASKYKKENLKMGNS
jgi:hypothetical protein